MPNIPLMEQYQAVKQKYPEEILFFRLGDFYEMFYEDARTVSRLLGLTLTSRYKGDKAVPMAGVPFHSATTYINRLLKAGHKIAICEQLEEAAASQGNVIERDVIRVLTPGTLVEENLLEQRTNNYLAAFHTSGAKAGLAWIDISTGIFQLTEGTPEELLNELSRLNPAEYLIPDRLAEESPKIAEQIKSQLSGTLTTFPAWAFDRDNAYRILTKHFQVANLVGFGCEDYRAGLGAAGSLLEYLKSAAGAHPGEPWSLPGSRMGENQLAVAGLKHITNLIPFHQANYLLIDRHTQRSLELVQTMQGEESTGTLLSILDKTATGMGARLLREWILRPLREIEPIKARQAAIAWFLSAPNKRQTLQRELRKMSDVERIVARLGTDRASARDLVALKNSLLLLPALRNTLSSGGAAETDSLRSLQEEIPTLIRENLSDLDPLGVDACTVLAQVVDSSGKSLKELTDYLGRALVDDPPLGIKEGQIIRPGFDAELDKTRAISREGKQWIARFEAAEVTRTGIPSLKVGFNNVFGYYLEVTNTHKSKIPSDYICKQTLKNAERYITPQLKDYETQVLHAEERANKMEYELFRQIRVKSTEYIPALQRVGLALARLDTLLALAQVAQENNYACPNVTNGLTIKIIDGRHPVLEKINKFIPNDVLLDNEANRILLITGPNMAGKSTYIRQVALLVLMAQMGSFLPCREAEIGLTDRIFTRVGASDELTRGASTFMVEMNEVAHILHNATNRSLIILDEVGRGTSTFDGVSIAWAVTEYLHDQTGSRTLFATHYHELTELSLLLPGLKNYHVQVKEWATPGGDQIVFLHKIAPGGTDKSYGIQVARLAGLPKNVIERARLILTNLEAQTLDEKDRPKFAPVNTKNITPTDPFQLALFHAVPSSFLKTLNELDPDQLTPLEALQKLQELKKQLGKDSAAGGGKKK